MAKTIPKEKETEIRRLLLEGVMMKKDISTMLGVSNTAINRIRINLVDEGLIDKPVRMTDEQVFDIRTKLMNGVTVTELTKEYGVTNSCIFYIRDMKVSKHIPVHGCYVESTESKNERKIKELLIEGVRNERLVTVYGFSRKAVIRIKKKMVEEGIIRPAFHKLTDDEVEEIRIKIMNGVPNHMLEKEYEVSEPVILDIKMMRSYTHVIVDGYDVDKVIRKKKHFKKTDEGDISKTNRKVDGIIYKATNTEDGKVYIGQTVMTLKRRKRNHKRDTEKSDNYFHRAIRKYSWDAFKWEVIDTAETEFELSEKEIKWIKHYRSFAGWSDSNGYNSTTGGEGTRGVIQTEEKIRKSLEAVGKLRPFIVFDIDENIIGEYDIITWAEEELGIYKSGLQDTLTDDVKKKGKVSATGTGGFIYSAIYTDEFTHMAMRIRIDEIKNPPSAYKNGAYKNATITKEQVLEIIDLAIEGLNQREISERLNIGRSGIGSIIQGETWKHIKLPKEKEEKLKELREMNKKKTARPSNEVVRAVRIRFMNGATNEEVIKEFGLSKSLTNNIKWMHSYQHVIVEGYDPRISAMNYHSKLSPQDKEQIKSLIIQGKKTDDIAKMYDVNPSTVNRIKKQMEADGIIPKSQYKKIDAKIDKIRELLKNGTNVKDIATQCNVGEATVYRLRKKMEAEGIAM
ncbi:hypothetical protein CN514_12340 [Bacillus sp. AFS001701]|uniref:helix-turn-helix domain-containing protein n=1 Tax=Bacillus sp. AFS001701 TaxID=2033480 RepID=UPI000BF4F800|nr:helix-turn-helix domain-containing protein [Bacillus sp. AFS001701]PET65153.1 hypothetical protein CN514_12340 [Bacillus sp. AFS001701]